MRSINLEVGYINNVNELVNEGAHTPAVTDRPSSEIVINPLILPGIVASEKSASVTRAMAGLRVYVDLLSQPSRAVMLFLRANNIQHEVKFISIAEGENRSEEYRKQVHPFCKVPAITNGSFKLFESVAILKYLARKYETPDHWYPKAIESQARVDEFLEWQHIGFRVPLASYFFAKVGKPLLMGVKSDEKELETLKAKMEAALNDFENVWMRTGSCVVGDNISLADLIALCEIDELAAAGYDPSIGRPKTKVWLEKVRSTLGANYEEIMGPLKLLSETTSKQ